MSWFKPTRAEQREEKTRLERNARRGPYIAIGYLCMLPVAVLAVKLCEWSGLPTRTYYGIVSGTSLTLAHALGTYIANKKSP